MNHDFLPALALVLATPAIVSADAPGDLDGVEFAQLTIRERIVIRIPRLAPAPPPAPVARAAYRSSYRAPPPQEPIVWREGKAPSCVPAAIVAGASITGDGDVDLVVTDGRRLRAKLDDDCPTLAFYSGLYLKRSEDGMICARRDALRSRSGARCEIGRFRTLVARK